MSTDEILELPIEQNARPRIRPTAHRNWFAKYERALRSIDVAMIVIAVGTAYLVKFGDDLRVSVGASPLTYAVTASIIGVVWWLVLGAFGSRQRRVIGHGLEEYIRVVSASHFTFGGIAIISYIFDAQFSRAFFLVLLPLGTFSIVFGRWGCRQVLNQVRARGGAFTRTVVVGAAHDVSEAVRDLRRNSHAGYQPVAIALSESADTFTVQNMPELADLPVIDLDSLNEHIARHGARAVVVAPGLPRTRVRQLAWELENAAVRLMFVPSLVDVAGPRLSVHPMQDLSLLSVELPRFTGWNHAVKRGFDILFSSVALLLLAPVMAVVAALIKREDGGPIVFRQRRVGLGGEEFVVHKFRTMCVDAEARIDALIAAAGGKALLFKLEDDPRITKIGKVLRKYSLDELPQFWTVLRGRMSVVGPRPQVAREVAEYTKDAHRRLLIKPGITGLWQVNGRSELSIEESIRLDLRYVENWSLTSDIAIILKTVRTVLQPAGAY